MEQRKETQGHLAALVTIFIWGTTFVSIKVLLKNFSPVEILFYRILLGFIVLLLIRPKIAAFKSVKEELKLMAAGICGITLFFIFQNTAISYTHASNVGIILSVAPFFTAILSRLLLKDETLRLNFFAGFAIAMIGIILIAFNGNYILKLNPLGDLLAILSAMVWAVYSILMKKIGETQSDTLQITQRVFFYGLLFLAPFLGFFEFRFGFERFASPSNTLNLLYLGIAASALCFVTWNFALKVLGPIRASVYIYATPVVTVVFSALLLRERITPVAMLGVILILCGLLLSEKRTVLKAGAKV